MLRSALIISAATTVFSFSATSGGLAKPPGKGFVICDQNGTRFCDGKLDGLRRRQDGGVRQEAGGIKVINAAKCNV
jgi:hypothetical protein